MPQAGAGPTNYYGTVTVGSSQKDGVNYLEDETWKVGVFDARRSTGNLYRVSSPTTVFNGATQKSAVEAQMGVIGIGQGVHGVSCWRGMILPEV